MVDGEDGGVVPPLAVQVAQMVPLLVLMAAAVAVLVDYWGGGLLAAAAAGPVSAVLVAGWMVRDFRRDAADGGLRRRKWMVSSSVTAAWRLRPVDVPSSRR